MDSLIAQLPRDALRVLDQPYVAGARAGSCPDSAQTLDLFVPAGAGPFPLILWIHGGGWHSGGKEPEGVRLALEFLPHGFALAAVAYRLTPDAPFPAQIEDCNAALAWLRARAGDYRIDPERIGVVGHSAGAHLCALMAVAGGTTAFTKNGGVAERVQAAVCWAPPCDLDRERGGWPRTMFPWNPEDKFCRTFFPGRSYEAEFARRASPASHVHGDMPPLIIVHGERDTVVPWGQAARFAEQLREAGVEATFRSDAERGHDVMSEQATEEALAFFKRVLHAKAG